MEGKLMTLCWHVDDMKVSHCDLKRADDMINRLPMKHEHLFKDGSGALKTCHGSKVRCCMAECIGTTLDFAAPGQVLPWRLLMTSESKTEISCSRGRTPVQS
jgi:hypothetical protein